MVEIPLDLCLTSQTTTMTLPMQSIALDLGRLLEDSRLAMSSSLRMLRSTTIEMEVLLCWIPMIPLPTLPTFWAVLVALVEGESRRSAWNVSHCENGPKRQEGTRTDR
jgi:hypothetical protein